MYAFTESPPGPAYVTHSPWVCTDSSFATYSAPKPVAALVNAGALCASDGVHAIAPTDNTGINQVFFMVPPGHRRLGPPTTAAADCSPCWRGPPRPPDQPRT